MFSYFLSKNHPVVPPIKKYTKFDWIKRRYEYEIDRITNYYQHRTRAVDNRNIFSRLIYLLQPSLELDLFSYFKEVDQNDEYLARQFHLTSNISKGRVHENVFYKDNSYTVITVVRSDYNLLTIGKDWQNLKPLRMIYTNSTDLDFYQYDRKKNARTTNLTIVELDIVMMLLQYRYWAKERLRDDFSTNPNVYVYQMLYPHLSTTAIDHILFNRLMWNFYGWMMPELNIDHPFHVLDYTKGIDTIYSSVIKDFQKSNLMLEGFFKTIPTIYYKDMLETLYINNPIYTRQSEWSIWLARTKYINFIIDILGERGLQRNRMYFYNMPALIKKLENRSTDIATVLPNNLYTDFLYDIEKIKQKVGRR